SWPTFSSIVIFLRSSSTRASIAGSLNSAFGRACLGAATVGVWAKDRNGAKSESESTKGSAGKQARKILLGEQKRYCWCIALNSKAKGFSNRESHRRKRRNRTAAKGFSKTIYL